MTKQREARERVLDLINGLEPGDALPAERQLSQELGVSRLTLRAALDRLTQEGYLVRRHGSGTYVREPSARAGLTADFAEDMRRRGHVPEARVLEFSRVPAGANLGRLLQVSPAQEAIVVRRLLLADKEPMAIEEVNLVSSFVPGIAEADLEEASLYALFAERFALRLGSCTQTAQPTVTDQAESQALGVPLHSPAFLFEKTTLTASGQVVEFSRCVYRGDRYRIVTELRDPAQLTSPSR